MSVHLEGFHVLRTSHVRLTASRSLQLQDDLKTLAKTLWPGVTVAFVALKDKRVPPWVYLALLARSPGDDPGVAPEERVVIGFAETPEVPPASELWRPSPSRA